MARHLADYLEASAARYPLRTAVVDPHGQPLTYADLNRQADALASFLASRGVSRGDRVGIVLPKGLPAVISIFGVLKAGAAYVPVDPSAPPDRGRRILTDCDIRALIVDASSLEVLPQGDAADHLAAVVVTNAAAAGSSGLTHVTPWERAIADPIRRDETRSDPIRPDLAYILYTSGSTGMPKGAMITHGNAISFIDWCSEAFAPLPDDRFSNHAPFHFDASVVDIYLSIKHGASVHLISDDLGRSPKELARFVADSRLTVWFSTPWILSLLVQFGHLGAHDASALRLVLFGGEIFPVKHLRELKRHWRSAVYYNLYGPTEITVACTAARIPDDVADGQGGAVSDRVPVHALRRADAGCRRPRGERRRRRGCCTSAVRPSLPATGTGRPRPPPSFSSATGSAGTTPATSSGSTRRMASPTSAGRIAW